MGSYEQKESKVYLTLFFFIVIQDVFIKLLGRDFKVLIV